MQKVLFHNVEADYCPECLGIWFDKDELRYAKDDEDRQLNWLDFDVWKEKKKFQIFPVGKKCPVCRIALAEVGYDDSKIKIDFCKKCEGIWLDRGEFKQIMVYLKSKGLHEVLRSYTKNLARQLWEVFAGPEKFREELDDFLMILKLMSYKFAAKHPLLNEIVHKNLPK